jgi:hypothetical protein
MTITKSQKIVVALLMLSVTCTMLSLLIKDFAIIFVGLGFISILVAMAVVVNAMKS